jgi:F1F0 ATPase subunit 2
MSETTTLVLACAAGAGLGGAFFGGLWWTVRRGLASPRAPLWFLGSLLLRAGVIVPGFILVAGGRWERFAACLAGFVAARLLLIRVTQPTTSAQSGPASEASDAT